MNQDYTWSNLCNITSYAINCMGELPGMPKLALDFPCTAAGLLASEASTRVVDLVPNANKS